MQFGGLRSIEDLKKQCDLELSFQKNQISLNYGAYQALKIGFFRDMHQKTVLPGPLLWNFPSKKIKFRRIMVPTRPSKLDFSEICIKKRYFQGCFLSNFCQKNRREVRWGYGKRTSRRKIWSPFFRREKKGTKFRYLEAALLSKMWE